MNAKFTDRQAKGGRTAVGPFPGIPYPTTLFRPGVLFLRVAFPRENFHLLDCTNLDDDVDSAEAGRRLVAIGVRRRAIRKQLVELLAPLLEDKPTDKEKAKRLL